MIRHITFTDEAWCQNCGRHPVLEFMITSGGEVNHPLCPYCGSVELEPHVARVGWILDTPGKVLAAAVLKELSFLLNAEGDVDPPALGPFSDGVRHK